MVQGTEGEKMIMIDIYMGVVIIGILVPVAIIIWRYLITGK
jgi:hypothetical protein